MFFYLFLCHFVFKPNLRGNKHTNFISYAIAYTLQKPYHDLLFTVHRIIMKFNQWKDAYPECPFIQLTTLDENRDAKQVTPDAPPQD